MRSRDSSCSWKSIGKCTASQSVLILFEEKTPKSLHTTYSVTVVCGLDGVHTLLLWEESWERVVLHLLLKLEREHTQWWIIKPHPLGRDLLTPELRPSLALVSPCTSWPEHWTPQGGSVGGRGGVNYKLCIAFREYTQTVRKIFVDLIFLNISFFAAYVCMKYLICRYKCRGTCLISENCKHLYSQNIPAM